MSKSKMKFDKSYHDLHCLDHLNTHQNSDFIRSLGINDFRHLKKNFLYLKILPEAYAFQPLC